MTSRYKLRTHGYRVNKEILFTKGIIFMKTLIIALALTLFTLSAQAKEISSKDTSVNIARVVNVISLETGSDVQANIAVEDTGGSTDVSPTQVIYLTLYLKGEMFSTDATFKLADIYALKNVTNLSDGVYELTIVNAPRLEEITYTVDARRALSEISKVSCGDEFDCDASESFQTKITMVRK